jgi:hypothetical protein
VGLRISRPGGMERAGVTSTGRGGATCRSGIGDGMASDRMRGGVIPTGWVCGAAWFALRAGVVARARPRAGVALVFGFMAGAVWLVLRLGRLVVWARLRGTDRPRDAVDKRLFAFFEVDFTSPP